MTFEEILEKDGRLVYRFRGVSMKPMLYQNRDLVVIEKVKDRLKKGDVVLYRRGKDYVLHRIVRVSEDGYVIRGDNTYANETGITDEDIVGVLTSFVRNGKTISTDDARYLRYVRFWNAVYPLRIPAVWMYRALKRTAGKRKK